MTDCFVSLKLFNRFTYLKQSDFKTTFDLVTSAFYLCPTFIPQNLHANVDLPQIAFSSEPTILS